MAHTTPYQYVRQLELHLRGIRPAGETDHEAQQAYMRLLNQSRLTQHVLRDYELTTLDEDTAAQLRLLPKAVKSLETLRSYLLIASEYDLVGPVDVAQYSAGLDDLVEKLR